MTDVKPRIALAIGDPAGVGPELAARIVADEDIRRDMDLLVVGDARILDEGARVAGVVLELDHLTAEDAIPDAMPRPVLLDLRNGDPGDIEVGTHSVKSGRSALDNFTVALGLGVAGAAGAVAFTPFNKAAMRLAHPTYDDEVAFLRERFPNEPAAAEFNILPNLWNARVSSHVPMSDVAGLVTQERILEMLDLTRQTMREAGFAEPRIAIAALNPHAGDGGNFGREEIDIIAPAVATARGRGLCCDGPFPADTVFWRARNAEFDAVLTMYHDQGQIAMKLIGFDSGVTLLGGLAIPILTPAHGSAYDIAGKGIANVGASKAALRLAASMARARYSGPYRSGGTALAAKALLA
ncbi:4-hydroxythreonine-4-phosphate dehydrogenase PdxA [Shinella sp.]|uniref:4-hydroxythreonine-4-phosphate dehydrogenase PdxA n=1 Tax=Shinella sp. TaxID=1870904 RepID=UPI003F7267E9